MSGQSYDIIQLNLNAAAALGLDYTPAEWLGDGWYIVDYWRGKATSVCGPFPTPEWAATVQDNADRAEGRS